MMENDLEHPTITALRRDGYKDFPKCSECGNKAIYFAGCDYQLCEDCAETMIFRMTTSKVMEAMGWEVD